MAAGASLKLVEPSNRLGPSFHRYISELGNEERYPFVLDFDASDFTAWLNRIRRLARPVGSPDAPVPSSTYCLVDGEELVGVSNLRHQLNDQVRHIGGHIGLGIRPSQRGRGLGTVLMARTIDKATAIGLTDLHIHCHANNPASAAMIVANGGVLHSQVAAADGLIVQRYVVSKQSA